MKIVFLAEIFNYKVFKHNFNSTIDKWTIEEKFHINVQQLYLS